MTGIEPASSAWEADILPMNYVRACICLASVLPTPAACKSLCKNISPDAERLCLHLRFANRLRSGTCLASVLSAPLACQSLCKDIVRLVPSQPSLGNKSTRSVLPFKLRLRSFSWNRTIVPHRYGFFHMKSV